MGYRGKVIEKNQAQDLRRHCLTYREIVAELGVSKARVSRWCRDVPVDPEVLAVRRRENHQRGNSRKRPSSLHTAKLAEIERCRREGAKRMAAISAAEHLQFGLGLDAGDGSKQFGKAYRATPDPSIRTAKHEFGCAHVSCSCSRTQRMILGLMGGLVQFDFLPG